MEVNQRFETPNQKLMKWWIYWRSWIMRHHQRFEKWSQISPIDLKSKIEFTNSEHIKFSNSNWISSFYFFFFRYSEICWKIISWWNWQIVKVEPLKWTPKRLFLWFSLRAFKWPEIILKLWFKLLQVTARRTIERLEREKVAENLRKYKFN